MNTCGKITFATKRAAERHQRGLNRAARKKRRGALQTDGGHAYYCGQCEAWHWSSMTKREAQRRGLL